MKGTRIIITASGMLTGGRVLHHAMRVLPNPDATIIFVGYQAAGTTGRRILDGEKEVRIMKHWIPVRCHVEKIDGFSAHADWKAVLRWLSGLKVTPKTSFHDARRTRSRASDGAAHPRQIRLDGGSSALRRNGGTVVKFYRISGCKNVGVSASGVKSSRLVLPIICQPPGDSSE